MVRLLITGTPGVGKTTIATELSRVYGAPLVNLNEVLKPILRWDPDLLTNYITDEDRARALITEHLKDLSSYVIDTVAVDLVDPSLIDWCVVLRLNPLQLMERLTGRGWPRCKIIENVLAEVVGSSLTMAINTFGKGRVIEVDTTGKGVDEVVSSIINHVSAGRAVVGVVDWLESLDTDTLIRLGREMDECVLSSRYT